MNDSDVIQSLQSLGVSNQTAKRIATIIDITSLNSKDLLPVLRWQKLIQSVWSTTPLPFAVHKWVYDQLFSKFDKIPAPVWFPDPKERENTHIAVWMKEFGFNDYSSFHRWTTEHYADFWQHIIQKLQIHFDKPYTAIVDLSAGTELPQWLNDAKLNIANSCFLADPESLAIVSQNEQGEFTKLSYGELDRLSNRIANALVATNRASGFRLKTGDSIAIIMPMTIQAVALYLGIIKAGMIVVSIADSFAAAEISTRLQIANVKAVFTQDVILRDDKIIPLYSRIVEAKASNLIVLKAKGRDSKRNNDPLREGDCDFEDFLKSATTNYTAVSCDPSSPINILFSSGTTGAPKAIPWVQNTPIKCASDAYFHHDLKPKDVFCWPSNLGWMMGPWLIFACLINRATIALYEGAPQGKKFGQFIEKAKVTHLGVVPTIVNTWRTTACMENKDGSNPGLPAVDWSFIKLFTSTGECSNVDDMLYLMWLANYRPIIEYCGGTEIAGAYITGTLVQPAAPATCTTAALGLEFLIIDETGKRTERGEVAIVPPSIGLSNTLLNKDHSQVYYQDMPRLADGRRLRRHGDEVECINSKFYNPKTSNNQQLFYRLHGRVDDTMKLSGIKVSSTEIERLLNEIPSVFETAAIAVEPSNGGPSQLIIFTVLAKRKLNSNEINKENLKVELKVEMQKRIKLHLNPLFKIQDIVIIEALPRTASNKVMRRLLREKYH